MNIPVRGHLLPSVGSIYLRFFLQKVDIEWRNLCSTYSSNHAEHISEIIFQFRVVVWPCHMNLFHIDFNKKTTRWRHIFSMLREAPSGLGELAWLLFKIRIIIFEKVIWTIICNYYEELRTRTHANWRYSCRCNQLLNNASFSVRVHGVENFCIHCVICVYTNTMVLGLTGRDGKISREKSEILVV